MPPSPPCFDCVAELFLRTEDESTNHYEVSGILHVLAPPNLRLEQWKYSSPSNPEALKVLT